MEILERLEKERQELVKVVEKSLDYIKSKHISQAEVSVARSTGLTTIVRNQETENVNFSKSKRLSICVINDNHEGVAATSALDPDSIKDTIDAAIEISKHTEKDIYCGLPDKEDLQHEFANFDVFYPCDPDPQDQIDKAMELEKICLGEKEIKQSRGSNYHSSYGQTVSGNTYGQMICENYSVFSNSISLIAERDDQMECSGGGHYTYAKNKLWSLEQIAEEAISNTKSKLGGKKLSTRTVPIILDKYNAPMIFNWLEVGLFGRAQFKKVSYITDCLGQQVMPNWLTVHEDPYVKGEMASSSFDSTGAKTIKRDIVTNGTVASYLLSAYSARQLKMKNTGNASGTYNWYITNSGISFDELVKKLDTGIIITETMGDDFNSITGDISIGISGLWVEHGEIIHPIKEMTLAGNVKDILKSVVAISNDINPKSAIKTGSILLSELKIAGS